MTFEEAKKELEEIKKQCQEMRRLMQNEEPWEKRVEALNQAIDALELKNELEKAIITQIVNPAKFHADLNKIKINKQYFESAEENRICEEETPEKTDAYKILRNK